MPVYEYKCKSCNSKYEVFHFTKEIAEDIVCPKCKSSEYEKLFSTFSANVSPGGNIKNDYDSPCMGCRNAPACGIN
jgi:putative FmdB family regulatory protein